MWVKKLCWDCMRIGDPLIRVSIEDVLLRPPTHSRLDWRAIVSKSLKEWKQAISV